MVPGASEDGGGGLGCFAGVDEFVVITQIFGVRTVVFGELGFLLGTCEDVGVGDCAAGCGDDVERFGCCAKTAAAAAAFWGVSFAEGAQGRAGEETVVVYLSG